MITRITLTPKEYKNFKNKIKDVIKMLNDWKKIEGREKTEDEVIDMHFQAGLETQADRKAGFGIVSLISENEL